MTYSEVNDHLPDDIVDPEQIEDIIGMIYASADFREGLEAFLAKRKPDWQGC